MTGIGSPCGACKFLRRKCVKGCIFAPYFCHEQGATHFSAIHKVFGASNVSKILSNLPVSDRCGAAISISYEAQARLKDPIYGCVSHIFALQQQVINLQAQLACVKEQTAQSFVKISSAPSCISTNPNDKYINNGRQNSNYLESFQNCFDQYYSNNMVPSQLSPNNLTNDMTSVIPYLDSMSMEYSNNASPGGCENMLYNRVGEANSDQFMSSVDYNEFQSMAFCSYTQHS